MKSVLWKGLVIASVSASLTGKTGRSGGTVIPSVSSAAPAGASASSGRRRGGGSCALEDSGPGIPASSGCGTAVEAARPSTRALAEAAVGNAPSITGLTVLSSGRRSASDPVPAPDRVPLTKTNGEGIGSSSSLNNGSTAGASSIAPTTRPTGKSSSSELEAGGDSTGAVLNRGCRGDLRKRLPKEKVAMRSVVKWLWRKAQKMNS